MLRGASIQTDEIRHQASKDGEAFSWPDKQIDVSAGLQSFKEAVEYYNSSGPLEKHPFFGRLTRRESDELNCRHAALHLSFVHPA